MIAVADRWDELRAEAADVALAGIRAESGARFCPEAVAALVAVVTRGQGPP